MKSFLLILFLLIAQYSFAQQPEQSINEHFSLTGKTNLKDGEKLKLYYASRQDSAIVKNGTFVFKGNLTGPSYAGLKHGETLLWDGPNAIRFVLEPIEMAIEVNENEFEKGIITGSPMQSLLEKLSYREKAIEYYSKNNLLLERLRKGDTSTATRDTIKKLRQSIEPVFEKARIAQYNYFLANPDAFLSSLFIGAVFKTIPKDSLMIYYQNFTPLQKNSYIGQSIFKSLNAIENSKIKAIAPAFEAKTLTGEKLMLSNFKGRKYVLLDFWFSNCKPCRESIPSLKIIYQKYKASGLEIVGFSIDGDEVLWRKTIADDGTEIWKQAMFRETSKDRSGRNIGEQYSVDSYPTFILIDKEGKIAGRFVGGGVNLNKGLKAKLKEIFE